MLQKVLKFGTLISLCLISIGVGILAFHLQRTSMRITGSLPQLDQPTLLQLAIPPQLIQDSSFIPSIKDKSAGTSFEPANFARPDIHFRPWTRWWLPGNQLDRLELIREIHQFWENGFGGLEVYPLSAGLDPAEATSDESHVFEFGTPTYLHNLHLILEEAAKRELQIDVLMGSGSPSGGRHISLEDNLLSLAFGEAFVLGGKYVELPLPLPRVPGSYYLTDMTAVNSPPTTTKHWIHFYQEQGELIALYATKYREGNRTGPSLDLNDYIRLDQDSTFLITSHVSPEKILQWEAPKGYWKLIAIYCLPTGERPVNSTDISPGFVLDPYDSTKVKAHLSYLFESTPGMFPFRGRGFRGIFSDHIVHHTDRYYAEGILDEFQQDHGYNLLPYLPILLQPGQDNYQVRDANWKRAPEFVFTDWDDRIRFDYSKTISDRFIRDYFGSSNSWASSRQLITRAQPYGLDIDIIKAVSKMDIPEAEQRFGGGSELFLKLISSGAVWADKPLISAENRRTYRPCRQYVSHAFENRR